VLDGPVRLEHPDARPDGRVHRPLGGAPGAGRQDPAYGPARPGGRLRPGTEPGWRTAGAQVNRGTRDPGRSRSPGRPERKAASNRTGKSIAPEICMYSCETVIGAAPLPGKNAPIDTLAWPAEGLQTIPDWIYTNESVYQREIERIFHGRTW